MSSPFFSMRWAGDGEANAGEFGNGVGQAAGLPGMAATEPVAPRGVWELRNLTQELPLEWMVKSVLIKQRFYQP